MEKRSLLYGAKTVSREVERGAKYDEIKEVIMINILNYEMLGFDEYVSETVTVLDKHREYEVIKGMKWYFIELPKFRKAHPDMDDKLNQWLAFLDNYDRGLVEMAEKKNKTIEKAREEMNYLTGDAAVRRLAELREKWEHDYVDTKEYGRLEGLKQGRKEAEEEAEKKEKTRIEQIVKEMKKNNLEIELIEKITGLTKKEIDEIN